MTKAIKRLMVKGMTKVFFSGKNKILEIDFMHYLLEMLKWDTLSLIRFVFTVNSLSYLLQKKESYKIGKNFEGRTLSHLFFVNDLKLFATTPE